MSNKPNRPKVALQRTTHGIVEERLMDLEAFNALPEGKYGWKKKTEEPEEVKNMKQGTGAGTTGSASGDKPLNAAQLAQKIYEAPTAEAVDALIPDGEIRKTILEAAEKRKAQLASA